MIDRNKHKETIAYRFFSLNKQLQVVKPWSLYVHVHTGCWILVKKNTGSRSGRVRVGPRLRFFTFLRSGPKKTSARSSLTEMQTKNLVPGISSFEGSLQFMFLLFLQLIVYFWKSRLEFIVKENSKMVDFQRRMGMLFKYDWFYSLSLVA